MVTTMFAGVEHNTNVIHDDRILGCRLGILVLKITMCVEQIIFLFFEEFSIIKLEQKYTMCMYVCIHRCTHLPTTHRVQSQYNKILGMM